MPVKTLRLGPMGKRNAMTPMLMSAAREATRHRSPHEGLFEACIKYARWIEAEQELPAPLQSTFLEWRDVLMPRTTSDDIIEILGSSVRQLSYEQARGKVVTLLRLANSCSDSPVDKPVKLPEFWY